MVQVVVSARSSRVASSAFPCPSQPFRTRQNGYRYNGPMLIMLLKKFAVPIPIIGVAALWLIRWKRGRGEKRAAKEAQPTQ
jgi:hypothetical protein